MAFAPMSVGPAPLQPEALVQWAEEHARARGEGCGALVTFLGVVRRTHQGRSVSFLEYEAHERLAVKVFETIQEEVHAEWPEVTLAIHHRTGRLAIGEASVAIVAAGGHRGEAFQACRYAIERVKQIAPVWKHEFYEDGDTWLEGPVADPSDAALRQAALARACA